MEVGHHAATRTIRMEDRWAEEYWGCCRGGGLKGCGCVGLGCVGWWVGECAGLGGCWAVGMRWGCWVGTWVEERTGPRHHAAAGTICMEVSWVG